MSLWARQAVYMILYACILLSSSVMPLPPRFCPTSCWMPSLQWNCGHFTWKGGNCTRPWRYLLNMMQALSSIVKQGVAEVLFIWEAKHYELPLLGLNWVSYQKYPEVPQLVWSDTCMDRSHRSHRSLNQDLGRRSVWCIPSLRRKPKQRCWNVVGVFTDIHWCPKSVEQIGGVLVICWWFAVRRSWELCCTFWATQRSVFACLLCLFPVAPGCTRLHQVVPSLPVTGRSGGDHLPSAGLDWCDLLRPCLTIFIQSYYYSISLSPYKFQLTNAHAKSWSLCHASSHQATVMILMMSWETSLEELARQRLCFVLTTILRQWQTPPLGWRSSSRCGRIRSHQSA